MIKLSILICNLISRRDKLNTLLEVIDKQATDEVEVLVESDNGEMSIGAKRNLLVSKAQGEYIAFVDDDDMISSDYIAKVLAAIETGVDCVGIEGVLLYEGRKWVFKHSIQFAGWYTGADAFYRTPNHLNPIKKSIAEKVKFPEIYNGEDQYYSKSVKPYIKTEKYIKGVIYIYDHEGRII